MKRKVIAFIFGFVLTGAAFSAVVLFFTAISAPERYNVLFVGSDQRNNERARSDVLFVVSIPKSADQQPFFLTIPRDTKIEHPEWGLEKIAHFYALGDRPEDGKELGNVDLTREVIEGLLGIEVDAVVEVTFTSFAEIVDMLGGAVLSARDSTGETFDGVDTGTLTGKTISGTEALVVIRDRFTGERSDFDRQADAREILRSLITKIKSPSTVKKLIAYFDDASQARLQYDKEQLIHFLLGAGIARKGKLTIGEMAEADLPGYGDRIYTPSFGKGLYYWVPDEEAIMQLIEEHFQ